MRNTLILLTFFLATACSLNRQIVNTDGSTYRFFSSPANGEKKLFIHLELPPSNAEKPLQVLVNEEIVPFEFLDNKSFLEVFISEFIDPETPAEEERNLLFLRLSAAEQIDVKVKYPTQELVYTNLPKQITEELEMMAVPQAN